MCVLTRNYAVSLYCDVWRNTANARCLFAISRVADHRKYKQPHDLRTKVKTAAELSSEARA